MKTIKILLLLMCLLPQVVYTQTTLPSKAMGKPQIFYNEQESWQWENIAKSHNWGRLSNNFWQVYIDRQGVKSYKSPSVSSNIMKSNLEFMEPYFVAKIEGDYALLYTEKYEQTDLKISSKATSIGWVQIDNLLLWNSCPRTIGQVYQKAVIVKDPSEIQNTKDINEVSPELSASPDRVVSTGYRAVDLEFYFVYKMTSNGSALLLTNSKITDANKMEKEKKGWMKRGLYTTWNERMCYEPNFGSAVEGRDVAIFKNTSAAREYKRSGATDNDLLWKDKITKKRWAPKQVRFPVLETNTNTYIVQVGTIGSLGKINKSSQSDLGEINRCLEKKDKILKKKDRINVVFVMDGTSSMQKYYQPMARALQSAMQQNRMQGAEMYFGAVVYRNYADGNNLVEMKQITKDHSSVANWLTTRECKSVGQTHYEALYYGLDYAISNMSWDKDNCNFLVLVGDAANKPSDERGKTLEGIVRKLADKQINLVVFQANHLNNDAYHEFPGQAQRMMTKELSSLVDRSIGRNDFKLKGQLYRTKVYGKNPLPYSAAYRFAEINKSENPEELKNIVESMIVGFKDEAQEKLVAVEQSIEMIGGNSDIGGVHYESKYIEEMLINLGLTKNDIEILKDRNTTLKLKGNTSRTANNIDVFLPTIFITKAELDELIESLEKVSKNISTNRRQGLQNALKTLALSYIGQGKDANNMSVDDIIEAVTGITNTAGRNALSGINIKDITNPNKVTDTQISSFIEIVKKDVDLLKRKRSDSSCYFESRNKLRYYYILMEDMPFQEHN